MHGFFGILFLKGLAEDFLGDYSSCFFFFPLFFFLPPGCLVSFPLSVETTFTSEARSSSF